MNENGNQVGTIQLLAMMAGLLVAPVTPALIWATIAANLPLALVLVQLFVMALISNWLSRKMIHHQERIDGAGDDHPMDNPWNSGPATG